MGMAEFSEVGDIVSAFASEDATIKIGMSINPDLDDEIKVTVVATGMGTPAVAVKSPQKNVNTSRHISSGQMNYDGLDKPTVMRQHSAQTARGEGRETRFGAQPKQGGDIEYLDIPAFLRRQAD
jgi:cell division protein FtsZ